MINLNYTATNTEAFDESIFSDLFSAEDSEALTWAENVVQKAYDRGMVAEYIKRNRSGDLTEDQDYIDFWASMTIIFGYITVLVRKIGLDSPSQQLLFKYLQQRNLFNNPNELLADLEYITEQYFNEIKKRGTAKIYSSKQDGEVVDGESRRIFGYSFLFKDEYIFALREPHKTVWFINQHSPIYKGITNLNLVQKGYKTAQSVFLAQEVINYFENVVQDGGILQFNDIVEYNNQFLAISPSNFPLVEFVDFLSVYPLIGNPILFLDAGVNTILLQSGEGIGGNDNNFNIIVSPGQIYEISFWIKGSGEFSFGVLGFDVNNIQLDLKNIVDDADLNWFFEDLQLPRNDVYYKVSGYIYNLNQTAINGLKTDTSLGVGNNLKFQDQHRSIIPQITCTSGEVLVYGLSIVPTNVDRSSTFIHTVNHVDLIAINRNGSLSIDEIYQAIKYYMLPYKSVLSIKELPNLDDPENPVIIEGEDFLLNKENEGIISGTKLMKYIA